MCTRGSDLALLCGPSTSPLGDKAVPPSARHLVLRVIAGVLLFASFYCFLWILSSASLACTACDCHYSLFAPTFRCRQPLIAEILTGLFLISAVTIFVMTRKRRASDASSKDGG
jgi:hypothetical protein